MRILLIAGGWSPEREVSLAGAELVAASLKDLGHLVDFFDLNFGYSALAERAARAEFAFINLHGSPGEDGIVQALLETVPCPYQGSGPSASLLALDKAATKAVCSARGIPTPEWKLLDGESATPALLPPLFVKPNRGGSSIGMSLVRDARDVPEAVRRCRNAFSEVLVEAFVPGVEVSCGVLGDAPLPPILIRPVGATFFDYDSKYKPGRSEEICPAPIPKAAATAIQAHALAAHRCLGLSGYSRSDYILSESGPMLIEVNTLPGMTPTSLLPQEAAAAGLSFNALVAELVRLGLARFSTGV